jgi:hypothetical protein
VWYFPKSVDDFDLIYAVDRRTQAAMDAEDFVVDDATEREVVEHVGEIVPDSWVAVFAAALRVEAVRLRDAARLVVAADQVNSLRIAKFEADKKRDSFDREETSIHVIT